MTIPFAYGVNRPPIEMFGAAKPIMGTLFTAIFIGSALFLLAGKAVLGAAGGLPARLGAWVAPLLILMYARYFVDKISGWVGSDAWASIAQWAFMAVPAVAGVLLLLLGNQSWQQMQVVPLCPNPRQSRWQQPLKKP